MNANLYALFETRFPAPEKPFLKLANGNVLTYGDMLSQTGRLANLLVSLGARPGDRVAAQVEKSATSIMLYLASLRAGCVFLPLNPAYQLHELEHLLTDASPHIVVAGPAAIGTVRKLADEAGVKHVVELGDDGSGELVAAGSQHPDAFVTAPRSENDLAAILYTSGTTGRAKGAMLSHRNLAVGVRVLHAAWGFEPDDVLLHILPTFHFHGLFVALHCALYNGSTVWFESRFDAARAISLLAHSTVCMGVPTHYVRLLAEPAFNADACRNMRLFISGSAPLMPDTFKAFKVRTGHTILERYGMTEGGMFVSNPYEGERRCGTVGFPLPGMSVRVVDDDGAPVKPGTTGSIEVKGDNVFVGYWNLPDKTAEEHTPDGFFRTGDLGVVDEDGYLAIVGRSKDLIISGGLNVYPKEVEEFLDGLAGVHESAVIGLPHPDFGEQVTAVVVLDPNPQAQARPSATCLIEAVNRAMASFKVPKAVYFTDELPRNAMGKVQKAVLRSLYGPDKS